MGVLAEDMGAELSHKCLVDTEGLRGERRDGEMALPGWWRQKRMPDAGRITGAPGRPGSQDHHTQQRRYDEMQ